MTWFSVRHVIQHEGLFEERITLWSADSHEEAIAKAEAEAAHHARRLGGSRSLGFFQSYELPSPPGDAAEVFSLIRASTLEPGAYLDHFFATGAELQKTEE